MYKVEIHEAVEDQPREVTIVLDKDDLETIIEALQSLAIMEDGKGRQDIMDLHIEFEDILEEME